MLFTHVSPSLSRYGRPLSLCLCLFNVLRKIILTAPFEESLSLVLFITPRLGLSITASVAGVGFFGLIHQKFDKNYKISYWDCCIETRARRTFSTTSFWWCHCTIDVAFLPLKSRTSSTTRPLLPFSLIMGKLCQAFLSPADSPFQRCSLMVWMGEELNRSVQCSCQNYKSENFKEIWPRIREWQQ